MSTCNGAWCQHRVCRANNLHRRLNVDVSRHWGRRFQFNVRTLPHACGIDASRTHTSYDRGWHHYFIWHRRLYLDVGTRVVDHRIDALHRWKCWWQVAQPLTVSAMPTSVRQLRLFGRAPRDPPVCGCNDVKRLATLTA